MVKLEQFIDNNLDHLSNLGSSEVIHLSLDNFDSDEVEYLKANYRFDYKDICIYFVKEYDEIWIENMNS